MREGEATETRGQVFQDICAESGGMSTRLTGDHPVLWHWTLREWVRWAEWMEWKRPCCKDAGETQKLEGEWMIREQRGGLRPSTYIPPQPFSFLSVVYTSGPTWQHQHEVLNPLDEKSRGLMMLQFAWASCRLGLMKINPLEQITDLVVHRHMTLSFIILMVKIPRQLSLLKGSGW